jgi:hypothetical protein
VVDWLPPTLSRFNQGTEYVLDPMPDRRAADPGAKVETPRSPFCAKQKRIAAIGPMINISGVVGDNLGDSQDFHGDPQARKTSLRVFERPVLERLKKIG